MSTHFDPVPLVGTGVDPVADIEDWLASPPVRALVEAFARTDQDHELARDLAARKGDAAERLARLDVFSRRWDTRRGRERNLADDLPVRPELQQLVRAAAEALGPVAAPGCATATTSTSWSWAASSAPAWPARPTPPI